jgi:hypothetical protein
MFPLRGDQVREDLINSLQNCLGIEELLHAERYKRENVYGWDANLTPTTMACLSGLFVESGVATTLTVGGCLRGDV